MRLHVDFAPIAAAVQRGAMTADERAAFIRALGAAALSHWKRLAQSELRSTSRDYVAGLSMEPEEGGDGVKIVLEGVIPNMVEHGWPGGDQRAFLLNSPKARTAKDGSKYLAVPFRHGTPGTSGRNVGAPMPASIHAAAKQLEPSLSAPNGGTKWGGRLKPTSQGVTPKAAKILSTKAKPWHATSVYMGMVRKEKTYERATQSSYMTFRMISSRVRRAAQHWYHPGITPRRFAEATQRHLDKLVADYAAKRTG